MDLFTPVVPLEKQHRNFISTSILGRLGEREVVLAWAEGFPNRDNNLVKEFQTKFNPQFWELYLHGLFKEYGFQMNWSGQRPDFDLTTKHGNLIVEATTANAADGATPEWAKAKMMTDGVRQKDFWPLNREAIIRLSSVLLKKLRMYQSAYRALPHVAGKPFVIAVAPFEQPDFQYQYDRAMRALLYDDYVDEATYFRNPASHPDGPPSVKLGFVEKDNGATIDLGIFLNDGWEEVSAVLFSCVATWGKTVAMSATPKRGGVTTCWSTDLNGLAEVRHAPIGIPSESISDGLQVFHNPFARRPLSLEVFRRKGVVQHYRAPQGHWVREGYDDCLQIRRTEAMSVAADDERPPAAG